MKNIKDQSDERLMEHFQNGSMQAFSEVYNRYSKRLLYFMYRLLQQDEPLAQDKLHDIFTRLIEKPTAFNKDKVFKPWIFAVAANECRKHYRMEKFVYLEEEHNFEETSLLPFDKMEQASFRSALYKELAVLSYEQRCTFVLRYQEKLSVVEIAEIMNCPAGTVKSRIYYSVKILSEKLAIYNPLKK